MARSEDGRVGAAEDLDGCVRVADEHQVDVRAPDNLQEAGSSGRQLLCVIDNDHPQRCQALSRLRVELQEIGSRTQDRRGVVGTRSREGRDLVVLSQNLSSHNPFGPILGLPQRREIASIEAALDGSHEQIPQLGAKASGGQCGLNVQRPGRGLALTRGVTGEELS